MFTQRFKIIILLSFLIVKPATCQVSWNSKYITSSGGKWISVADERGDMIPDFSKVGYRYGKSLPIVRTVKEVTAPVNVDATSLLQNAIDEVARMQPDENGIRGAIILKKGTYRVNGELRITAGGIVLRGEGDNEAGTVIIAAGNIKRTLLTVSGKSQAREIAGTRSRIKDKYVPVGSKSFEVEQVNSFSRGDLVVVMRPGTDTWIKDLKMDQIEEREGTKQWSAKEYDLKYERIITGIEGNKIQIDQPVVMAMEEKYGGGIVYKAADNRISENGVENILFISEYASETDENHGWYAIEFQNCVNCWVRNVTSRYFGNGCVALRGGAKYCTVTDSKCFEAKSQITGGRRYSFSIDGQMCLVMNCEATDGRHDYVTGSRVSGPNVFYNCRASRTHADIGPHHRWTTGTLYDNVVTDGEINIQDRGNWGSGHGWSGANQVLWNCSASTACVQNPWVSANNWCIGLTGKKVPGRLKDRPDGIWEGQNRPGLLPVSLYMGQKANDLKDPGYKVKKIMVINKGKLLFSEDYRQPMIITSEFKPVKEGWKVRAWHGNFRYVNEVLESIWETGHNPVLAYECNLSDVIVEVEFRYLPGAKPDSNAYCRINLSNPEAEPRSYLVSGWANSNAKNRSTGLVLENDVWAPGTITNVASAKVGFEAGKWYLMRLEVKGDFARLTCNNVTVTGNFPKFSTAKTLLSIGLGKSTHQVRSLKVYEAK